MVLRVHGMDEAGVRFPMGPQAEVVELVDTLASGVSGSNLVGVQISSSAPGHSVTATCMIRVHATLGSNPSAPTKFIFYSII